MTLTAIHKELKTVQKELAEIKSLASEVMNAKAADMYWDCNCDENYIHPKAEETCTVCGAHQEEQPDSREFEINKILPI